MRTRIAYDAQELKFEFYEQGKNGFKSSMALPNATSGVHGHPDGKTRNIRKRSICLIDTSHAASSWSHQFVKCPARKRKVPDHMKGPQEVRKMPHLSFSIKVFTFIRLMSSYVRDMLLFIWYTIGPITSLEGFVTWSCVSGKRMFGNSPRETSNQGSANHPLQPAVDAVERARRR